MIGFEMRTALLLLVGGLWATGALAHDEHGPADEEVVRGWGTVSGNVRLATDYVFRGFTNTDGGPQLQADLTWALDNGLYAGVWSSNTDFGGQGSTVEIDPFVGFAAQIGESAFSYNVGYWAYFYPGARFDADGDGQAENVDIDYWEIYAIGTWTAGGLSLSPALWYADNYSGDDFLDDVSSVSYELHWVYSLPADLLEGWLAGFSVSGYYGKQTFDETDGLPELDYYFYDAGISYRINQYTLDVRWHDTDDVDPAFLSSDLVGPRWVAAVTRSF